MILIFGHRFMLFIPEFHQFLCRLVLPITIGMLNNKLKHPVIARAFPTLPYVFRCQQPPLALPIHLHDRFFRQPGFDNERYLLQQRFTNPCAEPRCLATNRIDGWRVSGKNETQCGCLRPAIPVRESISYLAEHIDDASLMDLMFCPCDTFLDYGLVPYAVGGGSCALTTHDLMIFSPIVTR